MQGSFIGLRRRRAQRYTRPHSPCNGTCEREDIYDIGGISPIELQMVSNIESCLAACANVSQLVGSSNDIIREACRARWTDHSKPFRSTVQSICECNSCLCNESQSLLEKRIQLRSLHIFITVISLVVCYPPNVTRSSVPHFNFIRFSSSIITARIQLLRLGSRN